MRADRGNARRRALVGALLLLVPALAAAAGAVDALGFNPAKHPEAALGMFFAPDNRLTFHLRQPNGATRDFERDLAHPGKLDSVGGWRGSYGGDLVTITSPTNRPGGAIAYLFRRGRLVAFSHGGKTHKFPYEAARPPRPEEESPALRALVPVAAKTKAQIDREYAAKWIRSGRLQFPYANPNRSALFYGELVILFAAGALFLRRRRGACVTLSVLAGCALVALALAQSRGAMLGLAAGAVPVLIAFRRQVAALLRRRWTWVVLAGVALLAAAWLATAGHRFLTRGFKGRSVWSNQIRVELLHNAPMMVADAPDGWGRTGFEVGCAYLDWYQPLKVVVLGTSLINDHLTYFAMFGRLGRFLYFWAWLVALGVGGIILHRRRNPLPLAEALLLGVTASFNPMLSEWTLLVVPALSFAAVPWRQEWTRFRPYACTLALAALGAVAIVVGVTAVGERMKRPYVRVRHDGNRVLVKGLKPRTWIVNDGVSLGGVLAWKDLRAYYRKHRHADAVGCVRDVAHVPADAERLLLAGAAGDAWLRRITSDPAARARLPKEVVFVSPPFPPSALPPPLLKACKVTYVVGEFMSWCTPGEYKDAPAWVRVAPGMDLYIDNWVDYAFGGPKAE